MHGPTPLYGHLVLIIINFILNSTSEEAVMKVFYLLESIFSLMRFVVNVTKYAYRLSICILGYYKMAILYILYYIHQYPNTILVQYKVYMNLHEKIGAAEVKSITLS